MRVAVVGGGAAGFFAALAIKERDPALEVTLWESSAKLLSKVRISGGGRCNVTHACFDPRVLVNHYPRGSRELLGPFHRFQPKDTIQWFAERGVRLKEEADGRMFPVTDSSSTIIECFLNEARKLGVVIHTQKKLESVSRTDEGFQMRIRGQDPYLADRVVLATGSSRVGWEIAEGLGHQVQAPVPSLFTFNVPNFELEPLAGAVVNPARVKIEGSKLEQSGPLLVTHWGFSGPAALKLSAWGARCLAERAYEVVLRVDWLPEMSQDALREALLGEEKNLGTQRFSTIPKKLWRALCERSGVDLQRPMQRQGKAALSRLVETLKHDAYQVRGKTTNKEEFVTCGGIQLSEVHFKTMESRLCPGLYFCGEILNIDGVTGGFNFQNAWTTAWIVGQNF